MRILIKTNAVKSTKTFKAREGLDVPSIIRWYFDSRYLNSWEPISKIFITIFDEEGNIIDKLSPYIQEDFFKVVNQLKVGLK